MSLDLIICVVLTVCHAQAPVEKLKKDNGFLKRDREKFHDVMQRFEARKKNLIDTIAQEKAELAIRSEFLSALLD